MRPPEYVWVGPGWFPEKYWWRNPDDADVVVGPDRCNTTIMDLMAAGYFSTDPPPLLDSENVTISGLVNEN